ncbi:MAG: hypothetical protein HOE11_04680 [Candidatus Diapherotrites archaeon]|jgi:hypothetical protein|nr:hypothetical protein [Candidatus Diapherotrites archaeon]MBT4597174.1 hypothetical protein [Candidatus Diapherotrites archaeon]
MHGNTEFLFLFVPFFVVGVIALYSAITIPLFLIGNIILGIIGVACLAIDVFALLVQYVNWRYYKE